MPKAGSSAIQEGFAASTIEGCELLGLGNGNQNRACSLLFGGGATNRKKFHGRIDLPQTSRDEFDARLTRQFSESKAETLILTAEWVYTANEQMLRRVLRRFKPHFEAIEVYAYIRKPSEFIPSDFQQQYKISAPGFGLQWPDYALHLGRLDKVFGATCVHLRLFDRDRMKGGDAVLDFAEWANLSGLEPARKQVNTSLSAPGLSLLACFRRHRSGKDFPPGHPDLQALLGATKAMKSPRFVIEPDLVAAKIDAHRDDLAWLSERLGEAIEDHPRLPKEDDVVFGSEDDLKHAAARFVPLLDGKPTHRLPQGADEADALAWRRVVAWLNTPNDAETREQPQGLFARVARALPFKRL
ncbi:MAG: hypothetical protein RIG84_06700 [Roseovarius sp.]